MSVYEKKICFSIFETNSSYLVVIEPKVLELLLQNVCSALLSVMASWITEEGQAFWVKRLLRRENTFHLSVLLCLCLSNVKFMSLFL